MGINRLSPVYGSIVFTANKQSSQEPLTINSTEGENRMKTLNRRDFLKMGALTIGGAALVACAPPAAPAPAGEDDAVEMPAEEAVAIAWWHSWGGTTGLNALTAVEEAFNESSETVKVERLHVPELDDKLLTAIAGGTPPDVGVCCASYAQLFVRDVLLPVDDLIAGSDTINKEDFVTGLFESMTWQGNTYGVPALECGPRYGLLYNKALVDEAGLDPEALPETWDEMFEWHMALTKSDDAGNVEVIGFDPRDATAGAGPRTNIPLFWALTYGLDIWDQDDMTFHFDDEKFVRALGTIQKFYDTVGAEKMQAFRDSFGGWTQSPSSSFPSGVQGTLVSGYYAPGELAHSAPDKEFGVGWAPTPDDRRGVKFQSVGGHPAYIPKDAPQPEGAFSFVEFLTSNEVADIMFSTTGWLSGRKAFYDPNRPGADAYEGLPWYLQSVQDADELWAGPIIPIDAFVNQERNRTFDAVVYGEKTPEEAAADMQAACTDELANQFPELVG
jgi:multiple sugar transport system substrate-binding protein